MVVKIDKIQLIKYLIVGGSSAIFESLLFVIILGWFHLPTLVSNTIAFLMVYVYGFLLQKYWTFQSKDGETHKEAVKFFIIVFIGFVLNNFFVFFFVDVLRFIPLLGKILEVGIVFFWNFFGQKKWVFKK